MLFYLASNWFYTYNFNGFNGHQHGFPDVENPGINGFKIMIYLPVTRVDLFYNSRTVIQYP